MQSENEKHGVPSAFFWRRAHSFMGIFLVLFLIEHLTTNSQAALFFGDDGRGFIKSVNFIHSLPYLPVIELTLLGVPFAIHIIWGIKYLLTSKSNCLKNTGKDPYLPTYYANHAYTWQRITSWILVIGVLLHVFQMRFYEYPSQAKVGSQEYYMVKVGLDQGIYTLAKRLDIQVYNKDDITKENQELEKLLEKIDVPDSSFKKAITSMVELISGKGKSQVDQQKEVEKLLENQQVHQLQDFVHALNHWKVKDGEGVAVSKQAGTAFLLNIRETMKMPSMLLLYSFFVMAATFHAFNGLWTFCITWGFTLTKRSQHLMRMISTALMILIAFLGLMAVWGSYLINLNN